MALANTATLLARSGKRVLIVDWDLEAPGLERFFSSPLLRLSRSRLETPGVVDLIRSVAQGDFLAWRDCLIEITPKSTQAGTLSLITAGQLGRSEDIDYVHRLRQLDWSQLFDEHRLGEKIEEWRGEWAHSFDIVLIDSRTGITDVGNICTILLPDVLVLVFTTSGQSIDGIADVMRRSRAAQAALPVDRGRLAAVPLLSRDEREKESDISVGWRKRIAVTLGDFYRDWLPPQVDAQDVLRKLYIPQIAYWSFGERLPVVEREEEASDARSISAAYVRLARLIEHQLDWTKIEGDDRAFAEVIQRAETELLKAEEQRRLAEESERRVIEQMNALTAKNEANQRLLRAIWTMTHALFAILGIGAIALGATIDLDSSVRMFLVGAGGSAFAELYSGIRHLRRTTKSYAGILTDVLINMTAGLFITIGTLHPDISDRSMIYVFLAGVGVNSLVKLMISNPLRNTDP